MVGEYQVTHKLGEGGMGVVYAGVHPEIGKRVAIKVLGPQAAAHPDLIRRFKEEARAVNKIRHAHIIDIFAFNQLPDGRHYFVMEYLDGESLTDRLGRGPMDFSEMRRLLAQICSALEAAHQAGVIHRDLKPDNIWVATRTLSESSIKLLDFGIAKLNDLPNASSTQTGVPMGTPLYMPPEQGMGRAVDRRADIYALGVLLYQIFAGTLPFYGISAYEIVLKHVTEAPVPPSRHRAVWPKEMEAIILACLEKDPALRPATAKELGERIEAAFAAHARAPRSAGAALTVPRLTTVPPAPLEGEAINPPSKLPSWAKNLPSVAPVGTSQRDLSGAPPVGRRMQRRAATAITAMLLASGSFVAVLAIRGSKSAAPVPGIAATATPPAAVRPLTPAPAPAPVVVPALQPPRSATAPGRGKRARLAAPPRAAHDIPATTAAQHPAAPLRAAPLPIDDQASPRHSRLQLQTDLPTP